MSIEAVSWALNAPISGTQKILLIGLANHATAEFDHARPSVETLARYANCHPRNVQRGLRQLETDGWIEQTGSFAVNGRRDRVVNIYRLVPERGGAGVAPCDNGVASEGERGGAGVASGVALAPPEPSFKPSLETSKRENGRASANGGDVVGVWEHYLETFGRRYTFDPRRRAIIENALRVRSVDECKLAITGLSRSSYHVENGYKDVGYALKGGGRSPSPEATIDRMMAIAGGSVANGNGSGGGVVKRELPGGGSGHFDGRGQRLFFDLRPWGQLSANEQASAREMISMGQDPAER